MLRRILAPTLAATLILGACDDATTAPSATAAQVNRQHRIAVLGRM